MKKSVENISLTAYELTVLLRYIVNYKDLIINYDFEGDSSLGASCFIDIENISYNKSNNKNTIELENKNNRRLSILIPETLANNIQCKIIHEVSEVINYDKLREDDKRAYLNNQLDENKLYNKKRERHDFKLEIYNLHMYIYDLED